MTWYWVIFTMYAFLSTLLTGIALFAEGLDWDWGEVYNPITIYKASDVNYFGCFLLMIFYHLLFPIPAPFYWLYKLCTVGRR